MKFKRKKIRTASVGTFATINTTTLNNFYSKNYYLDNSLSHVCELEGREINRRQIQNRQSQVLINDAELLFVSNNTPFKDIVEVHPLVIKQDSMYGYGVMNILRRKKKRPFLIRIDSLMYVSSEGAQNILNKYSDGTKNVIKNIMIDNTKNNFTWEGR